jgi:uncharacterized membrane protein YraQ (UPF0718 family)
MNMEFVKNILVNFWATMGEMSPYLLFGFLIAGVLSVVVSPSVVERHLGGRGFWPIFKASMFGVPLPLCSCGVIPVAMGLRKHKASKAATLSFLLSTPQTGVDSILVTYSLLGPVFAIFRPVVALITGLVGGAGVELFAHDAIAGGSNEQCADECCNNNNEKPKTNWLVRIFRFGFYTLPADIGKPMLIGVFVAAILAAFVPDDFFADKLGQGFGAMILMMLIGIPLYVCATASVPIAAVLLAKGLTPGAVMVFLMTGPATNAVAFATIWKTLGGRVAIIYIMTVIVCALSAGVFLDYIMGYNFAAQMAHHHHEMMPAVVKNISAVVLLLVLVWPIIKNFKKKSHHNNS